MKSLNIRAAGWAILSVMLLSAPVMAEESADKRTVAELQTAAQGGDITATRALGILYYDGKEVTADYPKAFAYFKTGADKGDARSQYYLGLMYGNGEGVTEDDKLGFAWTLKSAQQGDSKGQNLLGYLYRYGEGVEKDEAKGLEWLRKAAEQGLGTAQETLGYLYLVGEGGLAKDEKEAFTWYKKAADGGDDSARQQVGFMLLTGKGTTKDTKAGLDMLKEVAREKSDGVTALGLVYLNGMGVPADYAKALAYLTQAANEGDAYGQYKLGAMYENAMGVKQNRVEAMKWYLLAAAQDDENAIVALDFIGKQMSGGDKSKAKALAKAFKPVPHQIAEPVTTIEGEAELVKKASVGNAEAQYLLGKFYLDAGDQAQALRWFQASADQGLGVAEYQMGMLQMGRSYHFVDPIVARHWFEKALIHGNEEALGMLGRIYKYGDGVPIDYAKAALYIKQAAELGEFASQYSLGDMYEHGKGVSQDNVQALKWYLLAAKVNPEDCQSAVDDLKLKMSVEDIDKANIQAKSFIPKATHSS